VREDYRKAIAAAGAQPGVGEEELRRQFRTSDLRCLNYRDDQFDCATLLALRSVDGRDVTRKEWLFSLALVPTVGGVVMGMAGLFQWHIHRTYSQVPVVASRAPQRCEQFSFRWREPNTKC
jgi:hypothetical protein